MKEEDGTMLEEHAKQNQSEILTEQGHKEDVADKNTAGSDASLNASSNNDKKPFLSDARIRFLKSLLVIGAAIAIAILVFPFFMDALNDAHQVTTIGGYEDSMASMTPEDILKMREQAVEYNKKIAEEQKSDVYAYQGENYDDEEYDNTLAPIEGSAVMGHIEIPRINVYLPITHGTHSEDLKYMIGHMFGTSVPIGGESTHSVLAGHTGLQNADLFTYLDRLLLDDVFYIHVLDEIHVYTVDQIKVVLPGDEVPYIQVEEGKDYITLFTCTPYGVNDHRLLVRGERTYPDLTYKPAEAKVANIDVRNILAWFVTLCLGSIPFMVAGFGLWLINKKKDADEEEAPAAELPKL